jgi:putative chitinase
MGIKVSLEQFKKIWSDQKSEALLKSLLPGLNDVLEKYKINENKYEVASFLAQVGHESAQGAFRMENLNYSAAGLQGTFKKYFPTLALANSYARQPQKIANRVYANRMLNGSEASGDGWKHRGRGGIQITGKDNYTRLAAWLGKSIDETIKFMETDEGFWIGAAWFWVVNGLDKLDDDASALLETKKINGGTLGLPDRQEILDRGIKYL